uniref:Uncharacterized protein n=1 Tax=viral metagenome TaxID=1070528 RepID=A0A6M3L3U2_9ZZZZ
MGDVINLDFKPAFIERSRVALIDMPEEKAKDIIRYLALMFLEEIRVGIEGEEESPFFNLVDEIYDEVTPHGCFFCDTSIDVNAVDFDENTVVCMECRCKLQKMEIYLMKKFGEGGDCGHIP